MTELQRLRHAERIATALVLLLGAAHTAIGIRQGAMNRDGIEYLDVGAAWLRRDWSEAISATWSPLYAVLLGPAALDVVPIGARLPLVHAMNFAVFAAALVAFRTLWRELGGAARRHADARSDSLAVPSLPWMMVGYTLFAWATLNLIRIWTVTPDMLMAGLLFAAATLLLRQRNAPAPRTAFLFGVALGFSYLAKPVMFALGIVFLCIAGLAWTVGLPRRTSLTYTGLAVAGFLVIALPWITAVSIKQGEPTVGESGRLTYLRHVNDVSYPFWTGGGSAGGEPLHPIRRVADGPDVWSFGDSEVGGTYPPGFDPAYWYAGVEPRLDLRRQLEELSGNVAFTFELLVRRLGVPVGALLTLLWWSRRRRPEPNADSPRLAATAAGPLALLAMGIAGVALYLPVLVEGRYLATFIVLGFGGALASVRVSASLGGEAVSRAATLAMIAGLLLEIVAFNLEGTAQTLGLSVAPRSFLSLKGASTARAPPAGSCVPPPVNPESGQTALRRGAGDQVAVARAVAAIADPGTPVGVIGCAYGSYWAWLADLRVVAEMPADQAAYWGASAERRAELEAAFSAAGARLLVAEVRPATLPVGWEQLGNTGLASRWLTGAP
jgi:hypothetical protein